MTSQSPLPKRPTFVALPLDKSGPAGNAWGLYGTDDVLGSLNLLTPEVIASAASTEIQTGQRVSLDWHLNKPSKSSFGRPDFEWKLHAEIFGGHKTINDDSVSFNTQCSSQWDGLRHFGYQKAKLFYGNRTQEDIEASEVLGIDAWAEKGGIVGRGVLLDYVAYCDRHGLKALNPFESEAIPLRVLKQIAEETGIVLRTGDVLFVRVGFTQAYNNLNADGQVVLAQRSKANYLGVESSRALLQWIWDSGFAAVAGDGPNFERAPIENWDWNGFDLEITDAGLLHQVLLGGWGMPIGEMFNLETLSEKCRKLGRWTFFVSSVPLKVPGGVASPPNAVAIF